jgi:hypothetical protein
MFLWIGLGAVVVLLLVLVVRKVVRVVLQRMLEEALIADLQASMASRGREQFLEDLERESLSDDMVDL